MRKLWVIGVLLALVPAAPAQAATVWVVQGRGWGHGIGMSQYGADGFARAGWGYERILRHYYRGTELRRVGGRTVRVLLIEKAGRPTISSSRAFRIVTPNGRTQRVLAGERRPVPKQLRGPIRYRPGAAPLAVNGRAYRGEIVVHPTGEVVNHVSLERYLRGVVPWEMPDHWHAEALKAQAVVARSYALAVLKPGKTFDLYSDVRSQVYGGIEAEAGTTNLAIGATAGRVLYYGSAVASTFYHSTSGGRTAAIEDVWTNADAVPYLRSVADPHDVRSKHHRWGPLRFTPRELATKLGMRGVRELRLERNGSGRVQSVWLQGARVPVVLHASDFRTKLGLRSTWFSVRELSLKPQRRKLVGVAAGGATLERRVGGEWRPVRRVSGRFELRAEPSWYRLTAAGSAGPQVRVRAA